MTRPSARPASRRQAHFGGNDKQAERVEKDSGSRNETTKKPKAPR